MYSEDVAAVGEEGARRTASISGRARMRGRCDTASRAPLTGHSASTALQGEAERGVADDSRMIGKKRCQLFSMDYATMGPRKHWQHGGQVVDETAHEQLVTLLVLEEDRRTRCIASIAVPRKGAGLYVRNKRIKYLEELGGGVLRS